MPSRPVGSRASGETRTAAKRRSSVASGASGEKSVLTEWSASGRKQSTVKVCICVVQSGVLGVVAEFGGGT